jgi:uncharacterized protein (TIGR03437 family)
MHMVDRGACTPFVGTGKWLCWRVVCVLVMMGAGASAAALGADYNSLDWPVFFEPNRGQAGPDVLFIARGPGYAMALKQDRIVLRLLPSRGAAEMGVLEWTLEPRGQTSAPPRGEATLPSLSHYFRGRDESRWQTGVPNYGRVRYPSVHPGIDLVIYGIQGRRLEYDYVVSPGADPGAISLHLSGAESLKVTPAGDLLIRTLGGDLLHKRPVAYQEIGGARVPVPVAYRLDAESGQVGFDLGSYDAGHTLTIDPVLDYSTYLGGAGLDVVRGVAVDAAGNAYVVGTTQSIDFPTTQGALQVTRPSAELPNDVFITKIHAEGTALVYSTYLGGTLSDTGNAIAVDGSGNVYVTGNTRSRDFPTAGNAAQQQNNDLGVSGGGDAFVAKLNGSGNQLLYSTYLGGRFGEVGLGIAVDAQGAAYVTGWTESGNFPLRSGSFNVTPCPGGSSDAFVTKVQPDGSAFVYSGLLCGAGSDQGNAIAVDSTGAVWVTGETDSPVFPLQVGLTAESRPSAEVVGFVTKVSATGDRALASRYLGGSGNSRGLGITVDNESAVYVAGATEAADFLTVPGAPQQVHNDGGTFEDGFLVKFNSDGSGPMISTFIGGENADRAYGVAVDANRNIYVAGETASPGFPSSGTPCQPGYRRQQDAFVTKFNATGTAIMYSMVIGGRERDTAFGIAVDSFGRAVIAGGTWSPDLPTTPSAIRHIYSVGYAGAQDGFVARISEAPDPTTPCISVGGIVNGASFLPGKVSPGKIVSIFGEGIGPAVLTPLVLNNGLFSTVLANTRVLFDGVPAPLIFVWSDQIGAIVPYTVAGRESTEVRVEFNGRTTTAIRVGVATAMPGVFSTDQSGVGQGAILNQDYSGNSPANPALRGSAVMVFATGEGQTTPGGVSGRVNTGVVPLPRPEQTVRATIGGMEVPVEYAGAAPDLVSGVLQVNLRIPQNAPTGSYVPVVITVGDTPSQRNLTMAIR